jgi:hypothetical protein
MNYKDRLKTKIKSAKDFFQKNEQVFFVALFIFILSLGIFLRTFHHNDWLHFQLDQSRDATIVSNAVRGGIDKLPLLGPQASGSELKLGPIFYYFQYGVAKFFGDRPNVMAWPDLFFAILSLPLFYLFLRNYFSKWISLGLLSIFSTSIFTVFYARFAWNPNSIPFFMLLLSVGLLNAVKEKSKNNFWWLYLSFFSVAVVGQLHFITFFLAPIILVTFLILSRPKIKIQHYFVGLLIFCFVYSPVIYSETKNNWQNSKAFVGTFAQRTELGDSSHGLFEKTFRAFQETSNFNLAIIASNQNTDVVNTKNKKGGLKFICDDTCDKYFPQMVFAWFAFALILAAITYKVIKEFRKGNKNSFLLLNFIWLGFFLILLVPISYKLSPRFYLAGVIPLVVSLGMLMQLFLAKFSSEKFKMIVFLGFFIVFALNLNAAIRFFQIEGSLKSDENAMNLYGRDIIMPGGMGVTLEQLEEIAKELKADAEKNNEEKIYIAVDNHYARSIFYILKYQLDAPVGCYFKLSDYESSFNKVVYYIERETSRQLGVKILENNNIEFQLKKGTLTVYKLKPKENLLKKETSFKGCNVF